MKRLSLVFCAVFAFCATSKADPTLALGIQGGVNFANASADSPVTSSTRTGFIGGIHIEIGVSSFLSLQPELMYLQKGAKFIDANNIKVTAEYNYIEIPILLRANLIPASEVRPFIFAGPNFIFNVSNAVVADVAGTTSTITNSASGRDFALDFGAGVDIGPIFAMARYSLGLSNVNNSSVTWKSRDIQLLAGIKLSI